MKFKLKQLRFILLVTLLTRPDVLWKDEYFHEAHQSERSPGDKVSDHACKTQLKNTRICTT